MTLIDLGSYAGAAVALVTLLSKLVNLITAIHDLIERIDWMQEELQSFCCQIQGIKEQVLDHDRRLLKVERKDERVVI